MVGAGGVVVYAGTALLARDWVVARLLAVGPFDHGRGRRMVVRVGSAEERILVGFLFALVAGRAVRPRGLARELAPVVHGLGRRVEVGRRRRLAKVGRVVFPCPCLRKQCAHVSAGLQVADGVVADQRTSPGRSMPGVRVR